MMNLGDMLRIDIGRLLSGEWPPVVRSRARYKKTKKTKRPRRILRAPRKSWRGPVYLGKYLWRRDLVYVTNQLAALIRCNAPLFEGLESAALDAPTSKLNRVFLALRSDIADGVSLWSAMQRQSRFFPRYYVDAVKAGEETGVPADSLIELSSATVQMHKPRDIVVGWLIYLGFAGSFQVLISAFLCVKVVPTFIDICKDFGATTPSSSQLLIDVTDFLYQKWWVICAWAGICLILYAIAIRVHRKRGIMDKAISGLLMCVVGVRSVVAKANLAHISAVLEKLLAGGVPMDTALDDCSRLDINPIYSRLMARLCKKAGNGCSLRESLESEKWLVPASFRSMVSIGESSGLLPEALERIRYAYTRDVMRSRVIMATFMAPVTVIILGIATLLINLGVMSLYYQMINNILDSI